MQVKEPTFSVSNMFTFNSQQYFKYFDLWKSLIEHIVHYPIGFEKKCFCIYGLILQEWVTFLQLRKCPWQTRWDF